MAMTYTELGADVCVLSEALIDRLALRHRLTVEIDRSFGFGRPLRQFERASRMLLIDGCAEASSQAFALAHQMALFEAQDVTAAVLAQAGFRSASANALCSVALANISLAP